MQIGKIKIYFWNYKKLAHDFVDGKVSEGAKALYFFLPYIMLFVLNVIMLLTGRHQSTSYRVISDAGVIQIQVIGFVFIAALTYYLFLINKKADNKDFLAKYFAFTITSAIRTLVRSLAVIVLINMIFAITKTNINALIFYSYFMGILAFSTVHYVYSIINSFLYIKQIHSYGVRVVKTAKPAAKKISMKVGRVNAKPVAKGKKRK